MKKIVIAGVAAGAVLVGLTGCSNAQAEWAEQTWQERVANMREAGRTESEEDLVAEQCANLRGEGGMAINSSSVSGVYMPGLSDQAVAWLGWSYHIPADAPADFEIPEGFEEKQVSREVFDWINDNLCGGTLGYDELEYVGLA